MKRVSCEADPSGAGCRAELGGGLGEAGAGRPALDAAGDPAHLLGERMTDGPEAHPPLGVGLDPHRRPPEERLLHLMELGKDTKPVAFGFQDVLKSTELAFAHALAATTTMSGTTDHVISPQLVSLCRQAGLQLYLLIPYHI